MSVRQSPYTSYSEFALNGDGRNGLTLALKQYQQKLVQTLAEMDQLRQSLAEKEKKLADTQVMPKDPPGSYWKWDNLERTSRTMYLSQGRHSHPIQQLWWSELYMTSNGHADTVFDARPVPTPGVDPYPTDGVVVQSRHGLLYVPSKLIRSLMRKAIKDAGGTEEDADMIMFDKDSGLHGKVAYLLEQMQKT